MTDEEVICGWMEPNPRSRTRSRDSDGGWWRLVGCDRKTATWEPTRYLTLDRLREVEARLTEEEWWKYARSLAIKIRGMDDEPMFPKDWIHATAESKIRALAAVLRDTRKGCSDAE